ncbi:unnamed protein product [Urochloa decumbens]|uniref:Uncharacterized protein n=1 Tax=Urochloa decumbens TaxID=240449 RepID=A0ABC8WB07_9POAL
MLASLFLLGTWLALLTLLQRRGRVPQHTYLDYSFTNLLAAVVIVVKIGQAGESMPGVPDFFTQLSQDNWPSVLMAMAGGLALSLGNLVSQYAWAFAGLSVTNIICSRMTVVVGTTINYLLDGRINRAEVLFPGVACFLIAVFHGAAVHSSNAKDDEQKLSMKSADIELSSYVSDEAKLLPDLEEPKDGDEEDYSVSSEAKQGTAEFIIQVEGRRSIKAARPRPQSGFLRWSLLLPLLASDQPGCQRSVALPQEGCPPPGGLHRLLLLLGVVFHARVGLNVWLLYRPMAGVPASTIGAYARDWNGRHWALLAGLLCGFGNGFQFMGGQAVGNAAADAIQALPLVSTFWGVILFGEYRRSSGKTYLLLAAMLSMFVIAVTVLMASAGHWKAIDANAKFIVTRLHNTYPASIHC